MNQVQRLVALARNLDLQFWLFESPANEYQPPPPPGWFGMRSSKRRGFFRLDNGQIPSAEEIDRRLKANEFREVPLTEPVETSTR